MNLIKHCFKNEIDGIIFNSLKIGMKCNKFFTLNKKIFHIPLYWWYFDTAKSGNRYSKAIRLAKNVDVFFNKEKTEFKNIYNRLIAYDGHEYHGAKSFYNNTGDERLTLVFFIDGITIEKSPYEVFKGKIDESIESEIRK